MEIREYVKKELDTLWSEYRRTASPQLYKVDLSNKLWKLKQDMLDAKRQK